MWINKKKYVALLDELVAARTQAANVEDRMSSIMAINNRRLERIEDYLRRNPLRTEFDGFIDRPELVSMNVSIGEIELMQLYRGGEKEFIEEISQRVAFELEGFVRRKTFDDRALERGYIKADDPVATVEVYRGKDGKERIKAD